LVLAQSVEHHKQKYQFITEETKDFSRALGSLTFCEIPEDLKSFFGRDAFLRVERRRIACEGLVLMITLIFQEEEEPSD